MAFRAVARFLSEHRRGLLVYGGLWALALLVRLIYLWQIRSSPFWDALLGDALVYDAWARRIAAGDWLGETVFFQAPGYPYFLGLVYTTFGTSPLAVRVVQSLLGATACLMLGLAARSWFSPRVGWLSGLALALCPAAIYFDGLIQKTSLASFWLCLLLLLLAVARRPGRGVWIWLAPGAVLALLTLTRENSMAFAPVIAVWLLVHQRRQPWRRRLLYPAAFLIGWLALLLPVALRNLAVGGEFHLTTANLGYNLFIGNSKDADGRYRPVRWRRGDALVERLDSLELAEAAMGRPVSDREASHYWTRRTIDDIAAQPGRWLQLLGRKFLLLINATELGDSEDQYTYAEHSTLLRWLTAAFHFGVLCPIAAAGAVLTWRWRRRLALWYLLVAAYAASVAVFYVFGRYRFPLVPLLLPFAAAGLLEAIRAFRHGKSRRLALAGLAALALAVTTNWHMVDRRQVPAATYYNLARLQFDAEDYTAAKGSCREALRRAPDYEVARLLLGNSLMELDRVREALDNYRQALHIAPDYADTHAKMANALHRLGETDEALRHYRRALQLDPTLAEAHNNLGGVLAERNQLNAAIEHFRAALDNDPSFAPAQKNLANALLSAGNHSKALEQFQAVLETGPEDVAAHVGCAACQVAAGDYRAAERHYREAVRLAPDSAEHHDRLALLLSRRGDLDGAALHFAECVRLRPDSTAARDNLGHVLFRLKRYQEAQVQFEAALALEPNSPKRHFDVAFVLARQGLRDEALRQARAALELDPDYRPAKRLLEELPKPPDPPAPP